MNFAIKIQIYTFYYNNKDLVPFIIDYWKKYATKVIVYDNESTDGGIEILKQYDWIEIRTFSTNKKFDPVKILDIKNQCYKECRNYDVDYVMVCDFDEVLLYGDNLIDKLVSLKMKGVNIIEANYYDALNIDFPKYNEVLLQACNNLKILKVNYDKLALFNPNIDIEFIQFSTNYLIKKIDKQLLSHKLPILHFKMVGLYHFQDTQRRLYSTSKLSLSYGYDKQSTANYFNTKNAIWYTNKLNIKNINQEVGEYKIQKDIPDEIDDKQIISYNNYYLNYICEDENGNMPIPCYSYDGIIVTMTSWPKRISNVPIVLKTILENTMLPEKIVINLAIEEFPNKENDLPNELLQLINENEIIEINWVKNNTKVWKKSIPTLLKYPNAYVLCIDDDFKYPKDFIETFSNKHKDMSNYPLSGVEWKIDGKEYNQHCGCSTLDSLKMLKSYIKILDKEIFEMGDEDTFMTYCYKKANIHIVYVGKQFFNNLPIISPTNPYSGKRRYKTTEVWKYLINKYDKMNLIELSCDFYKPKFNNNILICIFNYKHDNNAKKWLYMLKPFFNTIVLDSGNNYIEKEFIQYPNIYYSGLWNETKKIINNSSYNWVGIITSDVSISPKYKDLLINKINWVSTTKNIGQYQPSLDQKSANSNHKQQSNKGIIAVDFIEGMFTIMNRKIFDKIPFINSNENLYGMYIDNIFSALCIYNNFYNIYDNTYTIHHPEGSGYSKKNRKDYIKWCAKLKKELIGIDLSINNKELGFKQVDNPNIIYKPYVTSTISYTGKKEHPVFVSFTTWKKRLKYLDTYINNLVKQSYKVDKYIMWVSSDELSINDIPESIRNNDKIEIQWVDKNLKSFKKFLTIQQYPNAYNIILDDDRMYYNNIVSDLMNAANKNDKNDIICYYTDICNSKGQPWGGVQGNDITNYKWVNDSCILYQPNTFPMEIFDIFMDIMKDEPLISDECLIMPFLIYHKSNIISLYNDINGLNKVAKLMDYADNDALHNMFFRTPGRFDNNKKNELIKRIISKLNKEIQNSYYNAFKNFNI